MKLLAIETSCDETALAVLECAEHGGTHTFSVLGEALYSQVAKHAKYGGVYPTLAKREHAKNIIPLLKTALTKANVTENQSPVTLPKDAEVYFAELFHHEEGLATKMQQFLSTTPRPALDAIAVTIGPGLEPALWVGVNVAKALAYAWNLPIIAVNHLEGHLVASVAQKKEGDNVTHPTYTIHDVAFPLLGLIISGGHSQFVTSSTWGTYTIVGNTRDDSVGEAFDKVARMLGLPYPGGPEISRLATRSKEKKRIPQLPSTLPRPMHQSGDMDLSFSGLKTAVRYMVQNIGEVSDQQQEDIARAFTDAVTDVLIKKTLLGYTRYHPHTILIGGGVSRDTHITNGIRDALQTEAPSCNVCVPIPPLHTDNAIMIGMAGFLCHVRGEHIYTHETLPPAQGNLRLHTTAE
jgi:N6-L-threonylcarbamoyladenine synthase